MVCIAQRKQIKSGVLMRRFFISFIHCVELKRLNIISLDRAAHAARAASASAEFIAGDG